MLLEYSLDDARDESQEGYVRFVNRLVPALVCFAVVSCLALAAWYVSSFASGSASVFDFLCAFGGICGVVAIVWAVSATLTYSADQTVEAHDSALYGVLAERVESFYGGISFSDAAKESFSDALSERLLLSSPSHLGEVIVKRVDGSEIPCDAYWTVLGEYAKERSGKSSLDVRLYAVRYDEIPHL